MGKTLVAYFSAGGVTARAAEKLAGAVGADIFRIEPETPYTQADLDWRNKTSRSTIEMTNPASRPAIARVPENMQDYDRVFIGFPIWWGTAPRVIATFIEGCKLSGKTVIPFATSGGGGLGTTDADFKALCPEDAILKPGKLLVSQTTTDELSKWADSLM